MSFAMNLWHIANEKLVPIAKKNLNLESRLEDWIENESDVLGLDIMIIGRQVRTCFGGIIDLLGINREGDLVIIELKRNKTPRDIVGQCLDYSSWASGLGHDEIADIYDGYKSMDLAKGFGDYYEEVLPETVNVAQQIVIVAASIDDSTERIVQYLAEKFGVSINVIFFNIYSFQGEEVIGRSWLKDPEEVEETSKKGKRVPWSGYLFVNTGITKENCRDWALNKKFSFVSAGGGPRWISAIKKLRPGDKIFAFIKGTGYVGYGLVEDEAVIAYEYVSNGKNIVEDLPKEHPWRNIDVDPDKAEWLARVKWVKTCSQDEACWFKNAFANQNVVCKLRDKDTCDFLIREFNV